MIVFCIRLFLFLLTVIALIWLTFRLLRSPRFNSAVNRMTDTPSVAEATGSVMAAKKNLTKRIELTKAEIHQRKLDLKKLKSKQ
jgi:hypothetical protein